MQDTRKIIEETVAKLHAQGWRSRVGKHIVLFPSDKTKKPVIISYTPSDNRWYPTMMSKIRRAGGRI